MKTVKCSLLAVCLLFLLSLVSCSTCKAGHIQTSPSVSPANDLLTDEEAMTANDNDLDFDFEQYAYDDGADDETLPDDMDDDSDLEPAPEPDAPAPGGDDGGGAAPEPESTESGDEE